MCDSVEMRRNVERCQIGYESRSLIVFVYSFSQGNFASHTEGIDVHAWFQCKHEKSERVLTCQKYLKECIEVKVNETLGSGSLLTLKLQKFKWHLCGLQLRAFHDSWFVMLYGLTSLWGLALLWKCLGGAYFTGLLQHLDNI